MERKIQDGAFLLLRSDAGRNTPPMIVNGTKDSLPSILGLRQWHLRQHLYSGFG
jgi:hypothetical protein